MRGASLQDVAFLFFFQMKKDYSQAFWQVQHFFLHSFQYIWCTYRFVLKAFLGNFKIFFKVSLFY